VLSGDLQLDRKENRGRGVTVGVDVASTMAVAPAALHGIQSGQLVPPLGGVFIADLFAGERHLHPVAGTMADYELFNVRMYGKSRVRLQTDSASITAPLPRVRTPCPTVRVAALLDEENPRRPPLFCRTHGVCMVGLTLDSGRACWGSAIHSPARARSARNAAK